MKLKYLWPELYQEFFPKKLLHVNLEETRANCGSCSYSPPHYTKPDHYEAHLKCCTFQPYVPNYIVGAVLSDTSQKYVGVQEVMRKMISNREYTLPIGIVAPVRYQVQFNRRKKKIFGRDENFLCPYFDRARNSCGMWIYRGSVCTSFYCFSSYGRQGQVFWKKVLDFQSYIEMALMEEALVQLDFSPRQISENLQFLNRSKGTEKEMSSSRFPAGPFKKIWNGYGDDIESFYRKSYEVVKKVDKKGYLEAIGEFGIDLQRQVVDSAVSLTKTPVG